MPTDLPTLLHAATGLTWELEPGPWWYVSNDGRWYLSGSADDNAWLLTDRGSPREFPWLTMRDDEPVADFHQRVATEVAAAIREVTCVR